MPKDPITINQLIEKAHGNATAKGFWNTPQSFGESIALIHSELSEALEDYRAGRAPHETWYEGVPGSVGKPCGIPSELADAMIRIADLAGYWDIDLETIIREKMEYNATRPHMHGKTL